MRRLTFLAVLILGLGFCTRLRAQAALPTKTDVEAAMQRTFGYDPAVNWVIYDIRPSSIPGIADILLAINKHAPQHIYYSTETQQALVGEIIPFGPRPFDPVRVKLAAADGPSRGAEKPAINLVVFTDLECPHCKAAEPVLENLVKDFPQVRVVVQPFPLPASMHPWALTAAKFAHCVGKQNLDAFWTFTDAVFAHLDEINAANAEGTLKDLATAAGVDGNQAASCFSEAETGARIQHSVDFGRSLNVDQTPTVFINGRRVLGLADIPYPHLKQLVQFEIDHAGQ